MGFKKIMSQYSPNFSLKKPDNNRYETDNIDVETVYFNRQSSDTNSLITP